MPIDISPLWISIKVAALATCITFFLGIGAAYWMVNYQGRWKSLIDAILLSPLILPPTVLGFLLLILLGKNGLGQLLLSININIIFTWYAAVITACIVAFPLMYKTSAGAFAQIDSHVQHAARTLGASEWRIFWQIDLPLASKAIVAGTTLAFARSLGEFGATLMLAGNIPGQTQTIPMAIYFAVEAGAYTEAWFWVITILSISVVAIATVNFWQSAPKIKTRHRVNISTTDYPLSLTPYPLPNLLVDIKKQLADNFILNVCFNSNEQPLGLLGASGAGKSLILRCIAGLETPMQGRIILNGRVLFDSEQRINLAVRDRRVGFLFQNYALFPHLSVAQNIAFGLPSSTDKTKQVETYLAAVQLQGYAQRYPHELSGGQQQRVALARALATQPEALLLDEPFSALDTHLRSQLEQQLISTLSTYSGVTLFVTHNLEEVYRVCENLLVLDRGNAIAFGAKQDVFQHPQTFQVAQLTGCKNFSRAVAISSQQVHAVDWDCPLQVIEPIPNQLSYIGIRAHQIGFSVDPHQENTFPCFLAHTSETPHRITLFLKLHSSPRGFQDYHLQAEVFKEKWLLIKDRPFPWFVKLDALRLLLLV